MEAIQAAGEYRCAWGNGGGAIYAHDRNGGRCGGAGIARQDGIGSPRVQQKGDGLIRYLEFYAQRGSPELLSLGLVTRHPPSPAVGRQSPIGVKPRHVGALRVCRPLGEDNRISNGPSAGTMGMDW